MGRDGHDMSLDEIRGGLGLSVVPESLDNPEYSG